MASEQPVESPSSVEPQPVELDPARVAEFQQQLESEQNLVAGMIAGFAAALIGAALWAAVTVVTHYQIGWMAVGVGCLVGFSVRIFGKGLSSTYGIVGASMALFGCLVGNLLTACGFVSVEQGIPFANILMSLTPSLTMELLSITFSPMDLLFYGIAVYEGYQFSFRRITQAELAGLVPPAGDSRPV